MLNTWIVFILLYEKAFFLLHINNWTTNEISKKFSNSGTIDFLIDFAMIKEKLGNECNEISKNFLIVVHNVIHNVGNNGDTHRSLKCCI